MLGLPIATPGNVIGLLGGSFDPPHAGHVHITRQALQTFGFSKIWWLVSPGNPLKKIGPVKFTKRYQACSSIISNPLVCITDIELRLGSKFTADTLRKLTAIYPGVRFVWLMGADNLVNFHLWDNWDWIIQNFPIGVMARPGEQIKAGLSPAAIKYRKFRIPTYHASKLSYYSAPAWSLLVGPMRDISSTKIRMQGEWE